MSIKVLNTLTGEKEPFSPLKGNKVGIYVCGPTVYDYFHIGNARAFVVFDVIRRYLIYRGFDVTFVQNFTDIDDKMIKRANEIGISVKELGDRFIKEYFADADALGIMRADVHPRATEHINDIITLIQKLIDLGYAYEVDGDVYYETARFPEYGKLSHQKPDELEAGARIDVDERKRHPMDFALWKKAKPGEPWWDSPWGPGRPGWHIECSAMSMKYLGETLDIHAGGADLIFPHHENEIAQSEAATGKTFVKYWLHNGYLNIDGEKMSKSLGNFFTLRDIREKYNPEVIRFFLISAHYRRPLNFSAEQLQSAQSALERLYNTYYHLNHLLHAGGTNDAGPEAITAFRTQLEAAKEAFHTAMDDDFNTADALAALFEMARTINISAAAMPETVLQEAMETYRNLAGVLGLLQEVKEPSNGLKTLTDDLLNLIIEIRQDARQRKDWAVADKIRERLSSIGIILEDTPQGVRWKRKG